jgi:hypothetical protein
MESGKFWVGGYRRERVSSLPAPQEPPEAGRQNQGWQMRWLEPLFVEAGLCLSAIYRDRRIS